VERPRHAFAYVFAGDGRFVDASDPLPVKTELVDDTGSPGVETVGNRSLVLFDGGDEGVRFLLVSGVPLEEPVAWRGPIVMNTQDELQQAFGELRDGTFIR
jgi:redox-sensitive bicupin YhaK (pirin superfamily)